MYRPIPEETVQHILNQVDLVEVIGAYVQLRKTGRNFMGLCPFIQKKPPHFPYPLTSSCIIALAVEKAETHLPF